MKTKNTKQPAIRPQESLWGALESDGPRVISGVPEDMAYKYRRIVGAWLRDIRTDRGLTQKTLGEMLGMTNTSWSAVELGRNALMPRIYREVCEHLDLDGKEFGRFVLRYSNPHLYALLFGLKDADLIEDIEEIQRRHERQKNVRFTHRA